MPAARGRCLRSGSLPPGRQRTPRSRRRGGERHRDTAYVFAGSATRLLAQMTEDPERPFWRLGSRLFVREIPRGQFADHLRETFEASGRAPREDGIDAILDRADQVPLQRSASGARGVGAAECR